jgi:hypothetical protein
MGYYLFFRRKKKRQTKNKQDGGGDSVVMLLLFKRTADLLRNRGCSPSLQFGRYGRRAGFLRHHFAHVPPLSFADISWVRVTEPDPYVHQAQNWDDAEKPAQPEPPEPWTFEIKFIKEPMSTRIQLPEARARYHFSEIRRLLLILEQQVLSGQQKRFLTRILHNAKR